MIKMLLKQAYRNSLYAPLKAFERGFRGAIFSLLKSCFPTFNPFKIFGVPSKVTSVEATTVYPIEALKRTPPKTLETTTLQSFLKPQENTVEGKVTTLANGIALELGAHLTPHGELIKEFSQHFAIQDLSKHKLFNFRFHRLFPSIAHYDAKVLSLVADAHWNYFHWLFDVLPKIHLAQKRGLVFDALYGKGDLPFQQQSLEALDLAKTPWIDATTTPIISARELILTSFPCFGAIAPWVVSFLKESFLPPRKEGHYPEKLYISRKGALYRRILNEASLEEALFKRGFVALQLEKLSFQEQIAHFQHAKVIVSPHGAGLANLVFCSPGTKVVELFAPRFTSPLYWSLSNTCQLDYHFLVGKQDPTTYSKECIGHDAIIAPILRTLSTLNNMRLDN